MSLELLYEPEVSLLLLVLFLSSATWSASQVTMHIDKVELQVTCQRCLMNGAVGRTQSETNKSRFGVLTDGSMPNVFIYLLMVMFFQWQ